VTNPGFAFEVRPTFRDLRGRFARAERQLLEGRRDLVRTLGRRYVGYAREEASRRQVRNAFSHYLSPAMVEKLAEDPTRLSLGGEKRDMTAFFLDLAGFTTMSEKLSPEELTALIARAMASRVLNVSWSRLERPPLTSTMRSGVRTAARRA